MIEMSEILNVSLAYLLGMSSKPELSEASDMVPVPLLDSISADTPIEMINVDETYDIPSEIHDKYPQAFLLKVVDDSMNRVLPNGCYALINPCKEAIEPMKAYAVCVDDFDTTIQRVKPLSNGYELIPDSIDPTFRSQIFDFNEVDTQSVSIIGEVIWYLVPFGFEI